MSVKLAVLGVVQRSPYYPLMLPVGEGLVRAESAVIPLAPVRVIGGLHDGVVPATHQALGSHVRHGDKT